MKKINTFLQDTFEWPSSNVLWLLGILSMMIVFLFWFKSAGGFRELKKIWCDVHRNPATGAYSQKRLAMSFSFLLGWFICFTQAFTINLYPVQEFNSKEVPMWVPILLFVVGLGQMIALLQGHLNARKTADKNGNPLEPAYSEEDSTSKTETPTI